MSKFLDSSGLVEALKRVRNWVEGQGFLKEAVLDGYAKEADVESALSSKQDTLTAGDNITIKDNVISATGGGSGVTVDTAISETSENPVQNKVIAAALGAKASSEELSAEAAAREEGDTKLQEQIDKKQDVLTAGDGIEITKSEDGGLDISTWYATTQQVDLNAEEYTIGAHVVKTIAQSGETQSGTATLVGVNIPVGCSAIVMPPGSNAVDTSKVAIYESGSNIPVEELPYKALISNVNGTLYLTDLGLDADSYERLLWLGKVQVVEDTQSFSLDAHIVITGDEWNNRIITGHSIPKGQSAVLIGPAGTTFNVDALSPVLSDTSTRSVIRIFTNVDGTIYLSNE